jgi:hypothetical protein
VARAAGRGHHVGRQICVGGDDGALYQVRV